MFSELVNLSDVYISLSEFDFECKFGEYFKSFKVQVSINFMIKQNVEVLDFYLVI